MQPSRFAPLICAVALWIAPFLQLLSAPAGAAELSLFGGPLHHRGTGDDVTAWQFEYQQALSEHFAASFDYLNEGHLPDHNRDGTALQLWARTHLPGRRLSLAAGAGPYYFFDTTGTVADNSFRNDHGWGAISSLAATWYTDNRWLFQLRTNYIVAAGNFDTLAAVAGIGYQLDSPPQRGPLAREPERKAATRGQEITLWLGQTVANSFELQRSIAASLEYRRGLAPYLDWSVAWLYEGDNRLVRRDGVTTQLWAVRDFLDQRLDLGAGAGAYLVVDRYRDLLDGEGSSRFLSAILSLSGGYQILPRWDVRVSWNRILTSYNRDTDIFLGGLGYRF